MKKRTRQTISRFRMRAIAFVVVFSMALSAAASMPMDVFAEKSNTTARYSVLVLDVCGETEFLKDGEAFYTADSAIDYVKESSKTFLTDLINADGENYVALITYSNEAKIITDFTNDIDKVTNLIDSLSSNSNLRNLSDGLDKANLLLSNITGNATKNVILVTTGMVNDGFYSYDGIYDDNTTGSNWRRTDTDVRLYAYANSAYDRTLQIKEKANLYVLGLFQTMEDMPEYGKSIAQFFRLSAKDFASSDDTFFEIEDPSDIGFFFGEVSDDIINTVVSDNVNNHIDFINSGNTIYYYPNSELFNRVNRIAYADDGVIARESTEILKYFLDIKHYIDKDSFKNMMGDLSNSEFVAQTIVTEILSSGEFKEKMTQAVEKGVDTADEQLLLVLKLNANAFSVTEWDKEQIEILLNDTNKMSADHMAKRTALLERYYSKKITFSRVCDTVGGVSNFVGLVTDGNDLLEKFDKIAFKNARHMAEIPENEAFKQVKRFNFSLSEVMGMFSTCHDVWVFYRNVNALASASYAAQESLAVLKRELVVLNYELYSIDIRSEYTLQIIDYLDKIQKAFGDYYNDYRNEKIVGLIKDTVEDTAVFLVSEGIDQVLTAICPEVMAIMALPGLTCDVMLVLGGILTNVDERATERGYTLAVGAILEALANAFDNRGGNGYFAKKVLNDKTDYSVELYETGLSLYKKVAKMYEQHAEKYLSMLMDSKNLTKMAEDILLPEDYEEYKKLSIFANKRREVLSQLIVDGYSLNIWWIEINNITCHSGGSNNYTYVNPNTKKKYYLIACPVDVSVVNGKTKVANVENDDLNVMIDDPNVRIFTFMGEESDNFTKALLVPYDYDVKISGFDDGKMNVDKSVINNGTIIDLASFEDIPVKKGTQYSEVVEGDKLVDIVTETDITILQGDLNNDGIVNAKDSAILAAAFGKRKGNSGYNEAADFNDDGIINAKDKAIISANFGKRK